MAGEWIKMRSDLFEHPKVFKLADLLGVDEFAAVGMLFCFWAWADKHSVDGRVDAATTRLVDKCAHKSGFAEALVSIGWLIVDADGITIPRFNEHNGDSAKDRTLKNQRQARWRAGKKDSFVDEQASTCASTQATTREEKRREEKEDKSAGAMPTPDGVSSSVWQAFLKVRKAKRAPMSELALDGIKREAAAAGWTLENALSECVVRGWQAFKAEWVAGKPGQQSAPSALAGAI